MSYSFLTPDARNNYKKYNKKHCDAEVKEAGPNYARSRRKIVPQALTFATKYVPTNLPVKHYDDRELIALAAGTFLFPRLVDRSTFEIARDRDLIACGIQGSDFGDLRETTSDPSLSAHEQNLSLFYEQIQAGVPGISETWETDGSYRPGILGVMHRDFLDDREVMALAFRRGEPMALMWASPRLQADRQLVQIAVTAHPYSLQWACPETLR